MKSWLKPLAVVALVVAAKVLDVGSFEAFPSLSVPLTLDELVLALALLATALLPFADRRGIAP